MLARRAFLTKVPVPMAAKTKKTSSNRAARPAKTPKSAKKPAAAGSSKKSSARAESAAKAPSREDVSARAHQIWIDEGRPTGKSLEHWLRAERELGS